MTVTSLFTDRAGSIPFLNQLPAHAETGGPGDAERPRFPTFCHMTDAWRNGLLHGDQSVMFCFPVFVCPSLSQPATKAAALGHVLCTELTHSHRLCYLPLNQRLDSSLTPQKHLRALSHNPGFTLELPGKCNENKFIFILYKLCPSQEIIYASQIQHCVWTTVFFQTLNFLYCIGV